MLPTKEELALNVDEAEWSWMRGHQERGGVIIVAPGLDLAEVGVKLAADDAATVGSWIGEGRLGKPTAEQIATWDSEPEKRFLMLIVSPYILIQEKGLH